MTNHQRELLKFLDTITSNAGWVREFYLRWEIGIAWSTMEACGRRGWIERQNEKDNLNRLCRITEQGRRAC